MIRNILVICFKAAYVDIADSMKWRENNEYAFAGTYHNPFSLLVKALILLDVLQRILWPKYSRLPFQSLIFLFYENITCKV